MGRERLDTLLVKRDFFSSREKAKAAIIGENIRICNMLETKPGKTFDEDTLSNDVIELVGETLKYVSRGGLKLEKAIETFSIDLSDKICMDIGASTGGFTDCMLQNGAGKVYSVDVGHDQLDKKLLDDSRVINMEGVNFRYIGESDVPEKLDFASVDVSFISLLMILPPALPLLKDDGQMVCLIKPQFEAGRENVGKKGVVKDRKIHISVIGGIADNAQAFGFKVLGISFSPVRGPEGNIEYLIYLGKGSEDINAIPYSSIHRNDIIEVVESAHKEL